MVQRQGWGSCHEPAKHATCQLGQQGPGRLSPAASRHPEQPQQGPGGTHKGHLLQPRPAATGSRCARTRRHPRIRRPALGEKPACLDGARAAPLSLGFLAPKVALALALRRPGGGCRWSPGRTGRACRWGRRCQRPWNGSSPQRRALPSVYRHVSSFAGHRPSSSPVLSFLRGQMPQQLQIFPSPLQASSGPTYPIASPRAGPEDASICLFAPNNRELKVRAKRLPANVADLDSFPINPSAALFLNFFRACLDAAAPTLFLKRCQGASQGKERHFVHAQRSFEKKVVYFGTFKKILELKPGLHETRINLPLMS
ncbi:uncharacterized protein LOC133378017 [Rhineura floridana]|uniref:uncharacterized protein LOC133378017 n=1 Tax=Rhineura floridana TaxID=261503 RepID=UPI002AC86FAA|nr:uncharacterized protein LOC133378017 [Rhineura floridana]